MKRAFDEMFIEGAIHVVAECGIENARTKQMADYAGFSEASLFRAFGTKEGILRSTFLYIDKKLSDIISRSEFIENPLSGDFTPQFYSIWHKTFRTLVTNKEETIFLIRYRYSSLYTNEVRSMRQAYNGGFDKVYEVLEKKFGATTGTTNSYRGFFVNYVFEMTLCFAEKIITGRIKDTPETEKHIWMAIDAAVKGFTAIGA